MMSTEEALACKSEAFACEPSSTKLTELLIIIYDQQANYCEQFMNTRHKVHHEINLFCFHLGCMRIVHVHGDLIPMATVT